MTLLLAVLDCVWAHVDLVLLPCDPQDKMQLWNMGTRGMGFGDVLIHQSTKLCLIPQACDVDEGTPFVLDDCTSSCVSSHPDAGKFTLHHNGGSMPRVLELQGSTLVASASKDAPALILSQFDSKSPDHQQWTTKMPYTGLDHTLQVGKDKDGKVGKRAGEGKDGHYKDYEGPEGGNKGDDSKTDPGKKDYEKNESLSANDALVEQITKRVAARILKSALAKK